MTAKGNAKGGLKGRSRMRSEIVEAMRGLHKIGAVNDAELDKTTLRMLGRDALPKVPDLSPTEIVEVRERAGVSQAVLAGFLNVAVNAGDVVEMSVVHAGNLLRDGRGWQAGCGTPRAAG